MEYFERTLDEIKSELYNACWTMKYDRYDVKNSCREHLFSKDEPSDDDLCELALKLFYWKERPKGIRASLYRLAALRGHNGALLIYNRLLENGHA